MCPLPTALQSDEMRQAAPLPPAAPGQPAVEISRASFAWSPGAPPLLHDVDMSGELGVRGCSSRLVRGTAYPHSWPTLDESRPLLPGKPQPPRKTRLASLPVVPRGTLTIVVGSVGAGKSSLLAALLGEMATLQGSVVVRGATAYTQQDSWIQVGAKVMCLAVGRLG